MRSAFCRAWHSRLLLLVLVGLGSSACVTAHTSSIGTETGNPPVIHTPLVALEVSGKEVRITGKEGAVTPGGATVEVINLRTGKVSKATAAADGSFSVVADGASDDAYSVRAVIDGHESKSVYVVVGAAALGDGSNGSLSCMQRQDLAEASIGLAITDADTACKSDSDCTTASPNSVCSAGCSDAVASKAGAASIERAVSAIEGGLCSQFEHDGCSAITPPCIPLPLQVPRCMSGQCQLVDASPVACSSCAQDSLIWRHLGGLAYYEHSELTGCTHYTHQRDNFGTGAQPTCASELTACGGPAGRDALNAALGDVDVVRALAAPSPVLYGYDSTPVDGGLFELTVGQQTIQVGDACNGRSGCVEIPKGLQALAKLLDAISNDRLATSECRSLSPDCQLDFYAGTGTGATTSVYWHDPESLACLPRAYKGQAGNSNRYATQAECEQKCGTATMSQCGSTRQLASVCSQCGLAGGCFGPNVPACALPCKTGSDCPTNSIGTYCFNGTCQVGGCF